MTTAPATVDYRARSRRPVIREATAADVPELVRLGAEMHAESPAYSWLPFDDVLALANGHRWVMSDEHLVLTADDDGDLFGVLVGHLGRFFFSRRLIASDIVLYVRAERRGGLAASRMVKRFRDWATERGAAEMCIGVSAGIDSERIGRWLEAMGMDIGAVTYKRRLDVTP